MATQGGTHDQHVKAGQQSHKNDDKRETNQASSKSNDDKHRGGSGNFVEDRQKASDAGRKGGHH